MDLTNMKYPSYESANYILDLIGWGQTVNKSCRQPKTNTTAFYTTCNQTYENIFLKVGDVESYNTKQSLSKLT